MFALVKRFPLAAPPSIVSAAATMLRTTFADGPETLLAGIAAALERSR